ncbi:MAG: AAA family ATPase [Planctomycetota bacterium]|nr:MAG: AAA family ATPase [Planctomycetota bacterium]REK43294.1 MAG: AAA family ATPase [Planctomycetota bacterium]
MYEAYWQLQRKPFDSTSDAEFYYPAEPHQAAMLKMRYAVESRRAAAVLAGPPGLGKTLIVQHIRQYLDERFQPFVHLVFPQMPAVQLLAYLASEIGAATGHETGQGASETVRAIEERLRENRSAARHAVVAVDEAHLLQDPETIEMLRLLLNFSVDGQSPLTLLLVGQTSLLPMLERRPDLEQRIDVKCLLRLLNLEETVSYVNHRLAAAGAPRAIFEDDALEALFHLTHGTPRQINRLCDLALLIGFAEELPAINAAQIEAVSEELITVTPE